MEPRRTEKHEQARNSLPEELRSIFDDFVADYKFHGMKRHGAPYVSYMIMADMVRAGWRLAAEPTEDDSTKSENADG
jgi:hypothetical protein